MVVVIYRALASAMVERAIVAGLDLSDEMSVIQIIVMVGSCRLDFYFMGSHIGRSFFETGVGLVTADIHRLGICLSEHRLTESEIVTCPKFLFQVG